MVAVFGIFATLTFIDFKEMGVGLAVAILIDATIVRAVLLPATMKLLGRWNWYLPRKLGWLPHFSHEPRSSRARRVAIRGPRSGGAPAYGAGRLSVAPPRWPWPRRGLRPVQPDRLAGDLRGAGERAGRSRARWRCR